EPGSSDRFCSVVDNRSYFSVHCARLVSIGNSGVFASVYNQTLKDKRDCLLPAGWQQTSTEQGACIPTGGRQGEGVRRFEKGRQHCWLYSIFNAISKHYIVGIQATLGDR